MYCCSAQENKMDYKRRFLLGGSKQKVQQHQQYQMPELSRTLSAPLTSSPMGTGVGIPGSCHPPASGTTTAVADIQQGISKYLDALNVFCRASAFLTDLFSSVFRNSHYSKAAMQLKDVQEHVMEAASRLTAAIKPEIAKMLMELSVGAANFKDQNDFSLQDVEIKRQSITSKQASGCYKTSYKRSGSQEHYPLRSGVVIVQVFSANGRLKVMDS
uniref:Granule associated Rac and RHOG effector 1 n=1 Tax=Fundulus heteroclitus TaxID=8078 RepID=A0A3Q2UPP7_FUNHE